MRHRLQHHDLFQRQQPQIQNLILFPNNEEEWIFFHEEGFSLNFQHNLNVNKVKTHSMREKVVSNFLNG